MGIVTRECEWRHAPEACAEDFGDLRKVSELSSCVQTEKLSSSVRRRRLAFRASRGLAAGARTWFGADEKVVKERLCRKTFKLKGNKKFRTWTKKSLAFFVFRDSYVIYIWVMNILCTFHTHPYIWQWYTTPYWQLTTFSKFANFCIYKFRLSVAWSHLAKLLRHRARIPKFPSSFPQSNLWQDMNPWTLVGYLCTRLNFPIWLTFFPQRF